jgi:hypothetical protein
MGNWNITILGTGAHHNDYNVFDANKMADRFVQELKDAGHTVESATFTYGGRDVFKSTDGYGMGTYVGVPRTNEATQEMIRNIFADALKTTGEEMVKVCDGTAELTTAEAINSGELKALMEIYIRISKEVFNEAKSNG